MVETYDQQYFCEEKPPKEVFMCGQDGQDCNCPGVSIFARMTSDDGQPVSFEEAYEAGDIEFKKNKQGVACNANAFGAQDFLPGIQKHCFCDNQNVHHISHYRRKRAERLNREHIHAARMLQ